MRLGLHKPPVGLTPFVVFSFDGELLMFPPYRTVRPKVCGSPHGRSNRHSPP